MLSVTDTQARAGNRSQVASLAKIAVFDVGGPLLVYALLRANGVSAVISLVLSGILPAFGVLVSFARGRRLDAVGALVLLGIVIGTILGLVSGNPRLVLLEGSVPTAVFGLFCLATLRSSRPLMYRFALEFMGPDSEHGREFESLWQYREFRHVFRVITVVWGAGYLVEAAARVAIVEATSTGNALLISKIFPYVMAALLGAWTYAYGRASKRRGERMAAQAAAGAAVAVSAEPPSDPPPSDPPPSDPPPSDPPAAG